jgi:glycosyltransferase involved in cell wall biosynthesis
LNKGISIIICCYNSQDRLTTTLRAIKRLVLPKDVPVELMIVDNASKDNTVQVIEQILGQNQLSFPYTIVYEHKAGLVHARIAGVKMARYPLVLFVDDDNELNEDYLLRGYEILAADSSIGVLGGFSKGVFKEPLPSWINPGYPFKTLLNSLAVTSENTSAVGYLDELNEFVFGASSYYRKAILDQLVLTGYELKLSGRSGEILLSGDDQELCFIVRMAGYRIFRSDKLRFKHHIEQSRISKPYFIRLFTGFGYSSLILNVYEAVLQGKSVLEIRGQVKLLTQLKIALLGTLFLSLGNIWPSKFFKLRLLQAFERGRLNFLQDNSHLENIYKSVKALNDQLTDNPSAV